MIFRLLQKFKPKPRFVFTQILLALISILLCSPYGVLIYTDTSNIVNYDQIIAVSDARDYIEVRQKILDWTLVFTAVSSIVVIVGVILIDHEYPKSHQNAALAARRRNLYLKVGNVTLLQFAAISIGCHIALWSYAIYANMVTNALDNRVEGCLYIRGISITMTGVLVVTSFISTYSASRMLDLDDPDKKEPVDEEEMLYPNDSVLMRECGSTNTDTS